MITEEYNFIIRNGNEQPCDKDLFFQGDTVEYLDPTVNMWDVLVKCNIFPSKGQAKKDVKWKDKSVIPEGFTEFIVGKFKHKIFILNPITEI